MDWLILVLIALVAGVIGFIAYDKLKGSKEIIRCKYCGCRLEAEDTRMLPEYCGPDCYFKSLSERSG